MHGRRFDVGGGVTIAADAHGDSGAPPVILMHGGGQTRHAWGNTAASLAKAGWYALSIDLRGHGDSSWAPDGDYDLEAFASDLKEIAAMLGERPVLVGASLGGLIALVAQGESTDLVGSAVVLVDIAPRTEAAGVDRIIQFMRSAPDGFATLEEAADAVAAYQPHRPRPKSLEGLKKNLRLGQDGRYRWHWDPRFMSERGEAKYVSRYERLEAAARNLRVPSMLVRGKMSDVVSEEGARAYLKVVPDARYVDVSGASHMVAGDQNDPFTAAVVDFLDDVRKR